MFRKGLLGGAVALALVGAASVATAAVIETEANANLEASAYTVSFGSGGSLTFSDMDDASGTTTVGIGVATTGSAEVFSVLGAPDPFQLFAPGQFPRDEAGAFAAYGSPTGSPYSVANQLIGFEYTLGDGVHYGLARIGGDTVDAIYLQSSPGQGLALSVPEPATWGLMLAGAGLIGAALRRRRAALA